MSEQARRWQIILARQPEKMLHRLSWETLQQIDRAILGLRENPYPAECRPLTGHDGLYQLRVDAWRITYAVEEAKLVVLILEIAPRQQPERYQVDDELVEESPQSAKPDLGSLAKLIADRQARFITLQLLQKIAFAKLEDIELPEPIRLAVVIKDFEIRDRLFQLLATESTIKIVTIDENPDVVLTDVMLPGEAPPRIAPAMTTMICVRDLGDYLGAPLFLGTRELLQVPVSKETLMNSIHRVVQLGASVADAEEHRFKGAVRWFQQRKLGGRVELSLSVTDLTASLSFYRKLGLKKVDGRNEPYPWAIVSDGTLHLGLHQQPFASPTLTYFIYGVMGQVQFLKRLGISPDSIQLYDKSPHFLIDFALTADFKAHGDQRVVLAQLFPNFPKLLPARKFFADRHKFGELSLPVDDLDTAVTYWQQLGFECLVRSDQPYPSVTMTDGLIRLGFHQTKKFVKPTISYFAPDMPARLKRMQRNDIRFVSERKDAKRRRIGAVVESPDGQPFFLFTDGIG